MSGKSKKQVRCPYCQRLFKTHGFGTHKASCIAKRKRRRVIDKSV